MYIIYGAGGLGREVAWIVSRINAASVGSDYTGVVAFADDGAHDGRRLKGIPVLPIAEAIKCFPGAGVVLAEEDGTARQRMAERVRLLGGQCTGVIDPSVEADWDSLRIGDGCVICPGAVISVDVAIGSFVLIGPNCTIAPDTTLEDYATIRGA